MSYKLGILKGFADEHEFYAAACRELNIDFEIIDILSSDWINAFKQSGCDGFFCHPPNDIQETKSIFDEKVYLINKILNKPVYPNYESLLLYENKRNLVNWLQVNKIPHPESFVFARKNDAKDFFREAEFPLVFKTSVGASSSGVDIVKTRRKANRIANQVFGRTHPALAFGRLKFGGRLALPMPLFGRIQKHYLIVQKYYNIKWEWRIFFINDITAGFKKLLKGKFASGSKRKDWDAPPFRIFEFAHRIIKNHSFLNSVAIDIFETSEGELLVNEIQAHFGNPGRKYLMIYKGQKGYFKYNDDDYEFIRAEIDQNELNKIRINHFIELLKISR